MAETIHYSYTYASHKPEVKVFEYDEVKRMILDIVQGGGSYLDDVLCSRCDLNGTAQCPPEMNLNDPCKYESLTKEQLVDWYLSRGGPRKIKKEDRA